MAVAAPAIDVRERTINGLHPSARDFILAADVVTRTWAEIKAATPGTRGPLFGRLNREMAALRRACNAFIPTDEG